MTDRQEAIDLLVANIGSLPHEQYGVINLFPFAVKSDQTDSLKQQVCEAIVNLFADNGFLRDSTAEAPAKPVRDVSVNCRQCSTQLMHLRVDEGVANVPAATVLSTMARMNPECPHEVVTADDQRRKIEEAVRAANEVQ